MFITKKMNHLEQNKNLLCPFILKGTVSFFGTTTIITTLWGC